MKRLKPYDDDVSSGGEKEIDRTASFSTSSSHHRRFFSKGPPEKSRRRPEDDRRNNTSGMSMSSSFDDRSAVRKRVDHGFSDGFDDRDGFGGGRKRIEHDSASPDRRKASFDRYRERERDVVLSPRGGYVDRERERVQRSESFCVTRRDFPKGFRSERNWTRREDGGGGAGSSWRRLDRSKKDVDDDAKSEKGGNGNGGGGSSSSRGGMDSGGVSSSKESLRSPQGMKDVKSPSWSRDSRKELKDSKKNENVAVESGGSATGAASGCELEEGELQSDSHQGLVEGNQVGSERNVETASDAECGNSRQVYRDDGIKLDEVMSTQRAESVAANSVASVKRTEREKEKEENVSGEGTLSKGMDKIPSSQNGPVDISVCQDNKGTTVKANEVKDAYDRNLKGKQSEHSGFSSFSFETNPNLERFEQKDVNDSLSKKKTKNCFDLEVGLDEPNKDVRAEENPKEPELLSFVTKDKGKCVAVSSPDETCVRENSLLVERNFITCRDDAMEGSSARGFELFSSSSGPKLENSNQAGGSKSESEKLKLEPLDLSLGLSNHSNGSVPVLVPVPVPASIPVSDQVPTDFAAIQPNSPPHARSVQSFGTTLRTGSDCFTTSISFSGSQFIHNPSCSLTHNSVDHDFEQSVKSRPLFQGVDWQSLSGHDTLPKEIIAKQKVAANAIGTSNGNGNGNSNSTANANAYGNGNGSVYFSQAAMGILNGRAVQQQGVPSGLDRSASFQRQNSGKSRYQDNLRSPAHSGGSYDSRSEYGKDKKRLTGEESLSRLFRSMSQREMEQGIASERVLVERIIFEILSESIELMSRKVNEMPERILTFLKDTLCEIILKEENRKKLRALQEVLRKRSDLNLETLLKTHRVQLQILVAVKTGLPDFIQRGDSISSTDLAEIYLYLKCRNINCRSALPVDECDCRFCSQKEKGFCSSCMCLACSKFDTASNTCGWVGCDVCNHWCHTDCGLLKSYIRNGRSGSGVQGATEMQFYCLACEHPSEMFGFVKDVFKSCAGEWKAETLKKELEYVRRIFNASNDMRGKMLHDAAKQLIMRLQMGANAVDVCKQIFGFLNESDSKFNNASGSSGRELQLQHQPQPTDKTNPFTHEPSWSKPRPPKEPTHPETNSTTLPMAEGSSAGGKSWNSGMLTTLNKKPPVVIDELDSIIKVKLAEAEMFQKRADDARRESEGLQRIVIAKNEKIEEEYNARIGKLRLSEVEERRRKKHEELQMLERSHREYFNMKTRMEMDIKDLLLKMDATRRNLCAN